MSFLPPNQQRQSTEGKMATYTYAYMGWAAMQCDCKQQTDRLTDTQMAVANIHLASATPHVKHSYHFIALCRAICVYSSHPQKDFAAAVLQPTSREQPHLDYGKDATGLSYTVSIYHLLSAP